jgi:arabinofuranan 3-O-arabinosyltransferase
VVRFQVPLTTDRIDVSFPRVHRATIVTLTGQLETLPVRLSRLSVPALAGLSPVMPDEQARFTLACGQGPALTVDGRVYRTSVSGTIGELSQYLPMPVRLCSPGGTLSLAAGRHTLTAAVPGTFAVTDLSLTSISAASVGSGTARAVTIRSWQPDRRLLSIGPGAASYLEVHENYNPGWAATLNGQELTPVRLDGWQQGFIVPAGAGGSIALSFRPAATYHLVLAASMLAVAILLALAAWSFTPAGRRGAASGGLRSGEGATTEGGASRAARRRTGRYSAWLGLLAVTALIFVAGGPVALVVPLLACLAWLLPRPPAGTAAHDRPGWVPWLAFGGLVASGLLSAVRPFGEGLFGPFGWPAQACALVALAAALTPAVTLPAWRRPTTTEGEADR